MSAKKTDIEDLNFLIDEFFIYHGLEDLEKKSLSQDNELNQLMEEGYKILSNIDFIHSVIKKKSTNKINVPQKSYNTINYTKYINSRKIKIIPIKNENIRLTITNNSNYKLIPKAENNFNLRNSWCSSEPKRPKKTKNYREIFMNKYKNLFNVEYEKNTIDVSINDKDKYSLNKKNNNSLKKDLIKNPGVFVQVHSFREKKVENLFNMRKNVKKISTLKKYTIDLGDIKKNHY